MAEICYVSMDLYVIVTYVKNCLYFHKELRQLDWFYCYTILKIMDSFYEMFWDSIRL
jgi:hypothetical protein